MSGPVIFCGMTGLLLLILLKLICNVLWIQVILATGPGYARVFEICCFNFLRLGIHFGTHCLDFKAHHLISSMEIPDSGPTFRITVNKPVDKCKPRGGGLFGLAAVVLSKVCFHSMSRGIKPSF